MSFKRQTLDSQANAFTAARPLLNSVNADEEEEEGFYTLLLQLLSYRTILAVERQTCCGTAPTCREQ